MCDNVPRLAGKQRQLCQNYPDIMRSIGEGAREGVRECQHRFRHNRWNCSTLQGDSSVFGKSVIKSKWNLKYFCSVSSVTFGWVQLVKQP